MTRKQKGGQEGRREVRLGWEVKGEARMGGQRGAAGSIGEVAGGEGQQKEGMHEMTQ